MHRLVKNIVFILLALALQLKAADKYCVYFTDKAGSYFNPDTYFVYNNSNTTVDSTDFPLTEFYVKTVQKITGNISTKSRWLNAVVVKANEGEIEKVDQLSFVKSIVKLGSKSQLAGYKFKAALHNEAYSIMSDQLTSMQGQQFINKGFNGKGIRIAVFDAGFTGVDQSPVFEHLRNNGQIVKTWDFVKNQENVFAYNQHGTMVLSCLAGIYQNSELGLATGAEYLLARTESNMETLSEEEYWLQAVEWAYRNGADIINSSLGYTYHRYFENDMDGHTSLVAKAAAMAAEKGILVVNAMGNDGDNSWEYMCTPADVENVMAVGGINPETGIHIPFSSFGPTADKRMKPNVSAYGHVVTGSNKKLIEAYGTSFATPLVAGFAACVLQMHPDFNLETLFEEIEKSGNLYPYFDYAHGFGVPQAGYFTDSPTVKEEKISILKLNQTILVSPQDEGGKVFYHIQEPGDALEKYSVVEVTSAHAMQIPFSEVEGKILRVHYKGFTVEKSFVQ